MKSQRRPRRLPNFLRLTPTHATPPPPSEKKRRKKFWAYVPGDGSLADEDPIERRLNRQNRARKKSSGLPDIEADESWVVIGPGCRMRRHCGG